MNQYRQETLLQLEKHFETYIKIEEEIRFAEKYETKFHSLHECYAVILEEVDELWDITRMKQTDRNRINMEHELIQIAAMAIKGLRSIDSWQKATALKNYFTDEPEQKK